MNSNAEITGRRCFLRSTGVALALPFLESLSLRADGGGGVPQVTTSSVRPQRLVGIGNLLGFYQPEFFPEDAGRNYQETRLLKPLADHRNDFTLYSGLDHGVKGGHFAGDGLRTLIELVVQSASFRSN